MKGPRGTGPSTPAEGQAPEPYLAWVNECSRRGAAEAKGRRLV